MKRTLLFGGLLAMTVSCGPVTPQQADNVKSWAESGPYFGQTAPWGEAEIFMPELVTTHGRNGNISFLDDGRFCVFTSDESGTRFTVLEDDGWSTPRPVPWGRRQGLNDYTLGGDGRTFYWISPKPTDDADTREDFNIWKASWDAGAWTEPSPLPAPANHPDYNEIYPTATADGSVYYFCTDRPDSLHADIYVNRVENGEYSATERLPWPVNTDYIEFDFIVAPDNRYLIFASDRPGGFGQSDSYISFRRANGSWSHPINMGPAINSFGNEMRSFVAHDGSAYFFGSTRETAVPKGEVFVSEAALRYGDNDVYWIDGSIIDELRASASTTTCAAEIINRALLDGGTKAAVAALDELLRIDSGNHHFSLYELLNISQELIDDGRQDEAEIFVAALEDRFDRFRVRHGWAQILANHGQLDRALELLDDLSASGAAIDLPATLDFIYYDLAARNRSEDALRVLQAKIDRFPEIYHSYCRLAELHEQRGEIEEAIAACEQAIALNPDFRDAPALMDRLGSNRRTDHSAT